MRKLLPCESPVTIAGENVTMRSVEQIAPARREHEAQRAAAAAATSLTWLPSLQQQSVPSSCGRDTPTATTRQKAETDDAPAPY